MRSRVKQFRLGNQRPNLSQSSAPHRAQCDIAAHAPNVRRSTPADMHRAAARAWRNDNHRGQPSNPPRSVCSAWVVPPVACCRRASHAPMRRLPPVSAHWPKRYGSDEAISLRVVLKHNTLNSAGTLLKARCCIQAGAVWRHQRCRQTPWTDLTGWPTPHASPCIKSDARTQATHSRMPTPHYRRRAHDRPPQDDANRRPTSRNAPPHPDAAADPGRRLRQAAASTSGEATALLLRASRDATRAAQPLPARPR